jgi:precorrin-4/cobalt-precorrin-4 C11-methyltransferase
VAIGYRVSWPDEWLTVVPLAAMAATSRERELIRTTLYIVSPALAAAGSARSRLYAADHHHLFRGGA